MHGLSISSRRHSQLCVKCIRLILQYLFHRTSIMWEYETIFRITSIRLQVCKSMYDSLSRFIDYTIESINQQYSTVTLQVQISQGLVVISLMVIEATCYLQSDFISSEGRVGSIISNLNSLYYMRITISIDSVDT